MPVMLIFHFVFWLAVPPSTHLPNYHLSWSYKHFRHQMSDIAKLKRPCYFQVCFEKIKNYTRNCRRCLWKMETAESKKCEDWSQRCQFSYLSRWCASRLEIQKKKSLDNKQLKNSHVQYSPKAPTTTTTLTQMKTQIRSHLRVLATELTMNNSESTSNTDTLNTTQVNRC